MIALYADLRIFQNIFLEHGGLDELKNQTRTIMHDYVLENNTYDLTANEVILNLRSLYNPVTDSFHDESLLETGVVFD